MPRQKQIKVVDAKIPFLINIEKKDLKKAKPGDMDNCAVAKAIGRQLGSSRVCVGTKIISILKDNLLIRFKTPNVISKKLPIFDKTGCWALPFGTYALLPPSRSYKIKNRIADTEKRRPKNYKSKKKTGKPFRYASTRVLHSRKSSHFKKAMGKLLKIQS